VNVVAGILVGDGRHLDELRTGEAERVLLLLRLRLGDHDHGLQPKRRADQRQPDARIPSCPFDDGAARLQPSGFHGIPDHEQGGSVLDRSTRVHELGLA
jgi:hypothetical protein